MEDVFVSAPGWYPDPGQTGSLRYFDGTRWTDERSAIEEPGSGTATANAPVPRYRPPAYPSPAPDLEPRAAAQVRAAPRTDDDDDGPPAPGRRPGRPRRVRPMVGALCAALLAGGLTGAWFAVHRSSSDGFTFDGEAIDDPAATLTRAEKAVDTLVAGRHGVKSPDTRCYFAVPENPSGGAEKTDVDRAVRCGPVLFVDGDSARTYLSYSLSSAPGGGGVTLAPAAQPIDPQPDLPPAGFALRRPDGKRAPVDPHLAVPSPRAAAPGTLVAADLGDETLPSAPPGALMASLRGGVRLAKVGLVERFGTGDAARGAPPGQRLVAFSYAPVPGQIADVRPSPDQLGVSINGGPVRPLPAVKATQAVVVAVPTRARAELVLKADGVRQALALPSGTPASSNLAVLRRSTIDATLSVDRPITFRFARPGNVTNLAGTLTVTRALLGYWTDDGKHHASGAGRALLWMDFRFRAPDQAKETGVDAPLLRLTPATGGPVVAEDLDPSSRVFAVFDVPFDFTEGTVTVSGAEAGDPSISVVTPVAFPVSVRR
jgi:hypothetical protein